jgi:outer membrane biosynthesis protein TonB
LRTDWTISACCHAVVLGAALVSFAPSRLPVTHVESIPVNIVTDTTTSEMTRGQTNAPKEAKNPFADKIGEQKTVDNPNAKIAPKEVTASTDATPPPSPPEPKQEAKQKAEPKRDLIAEALKKDAAKQAEQKKADAKKADAKIPTPPKRPPQPNQNQPKFDPREMQALLDKRDPQRKEATGATLSNTPSVGTSKGRAAQLSQDELDALRARLRQLWNPPAGARNPEEIVVTIRIRLNRDGSLAAPPEITNSGRSTLYMVSRERAAIAVVRGAPFNMLRPENYEAWKDIEITFDPREMIQG